MSADLYLCVDCGGTKTAVAIADAKGSIVAKAVGGPSNFAYIGLENFVITVKAAVEDALRAYISNSSEPITGLPKAEDVSLPIEPSPFAGAWFGISGCDGVSAANRITSGISPILALPPGPRLRVHNDTHLLAAPLDLHPDAQYAVASIAGTGSCNVSFRSAQTAGFGPEELARCGGYGWMLGDEGGGFHVGREVLRQIVLEYDRSSLYGGTLKPSIVSQKVVHHFGVETPPDLLTLIHDPDPPTYKDALSALQASSSSLPLHRLIPREKRLSQLAPLVFEAAFIDNDPIALRTLEITSTALAEQIEVLLTPADAPNAVVAKESVLCFGGSLAGIKSYQDMIVAALRRNGHEFKYVEFVADASVAGAIALSAQLGPLAA